ALDYAIGGLAVTSYHVTSVLLHAVNVVLLFILTRRAFSAWRPLAATPAGAGPQQAPPGRKRAAKDDRRRPGSADAAAFAAAAVFAVHPMMTQAVGYISGRAEVLCALFFLSACLAAQTWLAGRGPAWLAALSGAWALSLASKEVAIALPLILIAYGFFWPGIGEAARRRLSWAAAIMLGLMAGAAVYRLTTLVHVENAARAGFTWANVLVGFDMVRQYTKLMAIPVGQSIFHSASLGEVTAVKGVVISLLWIAGLCVIAWRSRRTEPVAGLGVTWFLLLLLPSSFLLVLDIGEPMAEQRVYLAACGFAMACGSGYARLAAWPRLPGGAVPARLALGACVVVLALLTVGRNQLWRDPIALWSEAVAREPRVWVPYVGLGDALRERGDYPAAADAYREAVGLRPDEPAPYLPLATSLLMSGHGDEADKYFERADELSPGGVEAPVGRALAARMSGRRDEARDRLEAVARFHARAVRPRRLLAVMYEQDYGDRASALRACLEVRALAPNTPGVEECVRRNEEPGGNGR
ncbi:MAG: tetratricopeptide repeat protein, partial [Acidobacteria bacterium]